MFFSAVILLIDMVNAELNTWGVSQLNEFLSELEWSVQHNSETLISELALRDELEFEKELKNTFISLLLNVQNKRRQISAAGQKKVVPSSKNGNPKANGAATHLDAKVISHSVSLWPSIWGRNVRASPLIEPTKWTKRSDFFGFFFSFLLKRVSCCLLPLESSIIVSVVTFLAW
jgi:FEZ-like protein